MRRKVEVTELDDSTQVKVGRVVIIVTAEHVTLRADGKRVFRHRFDRRAVSVDRAREAVRTVGGSRRSPKGPRGAHDR